MKKIIIVFLITLFWVACSSDPTGPGEVILEAHSLAISSSNQLFISTQEGLCQSLDGGETWRSIDRSLTGLVAVSPSGTIYCMKTASKGLYNHNEWLYRSSDDGKTFLPTGWAKYDEFIGMIWLTFNTQEHLFGNVLGEGIFRSNSQGESWEQLWVGSGSPLIAPDKLFLNADGVYRSDDNGDSWTKVLELQDATGDTTFYYGPLTFNSQGRIFASIEATYLGDSVKIGIVYHSDNNGNSWIKSKATNSRIAHLAINSADKIFALTELNEVYCSVDNGIQWNKVNVNSFAGWVVQFIICLDNKIFIRTSDSKLYRSIDEGATWQLIKLHL